MAIHADIIRRVSFRVQLPLPTNGVLFRIVLVSLAKDPPDGDSRCKTDGSLRCKSLVSKRDSRETNEGRRGSSA